MTVARFPFEQVPKVLDLAQELYTKRNAIQDTFGSVYDEFPSERDPSASEFRKYLLTTPDRSPEISQAVSYLEQLELLFEELRILGLPRKSKMDVQALFAGDFRWSNVTPGFLIDLILNVSPAAESGSGEKPGVG